MDKRGLENYVLGIIVAIMCIAILLTTVPPLLASFFGKTNSQNAERTLESFKVYLNESDTATEPVKFVALVPKNWFLTSFFEGNGPDDCLGKNCVCICSTQDCKKDKACANIEKKVLQNGIQASIKIPADIFIISGENYDISAFSSTESWKPSSNTEIDNWFGSHHYPALYGLGQCIIDNSERTGVPIEIILAVAIHESDGGTSIRARKSCITDPSKPSNNLFGVTDVAGPGPAGVCWTAGAGTEECLTESEREEAGTTETCDFPCGDKACYLVRRGFKAYYTQCQSVEDFTNIISNSYKTAMQYKDNLRLMANAIGPTYSTDSTWGDQVATIAESIKSSMGAA